MQHLVADLEALLGQEAVRKHAPLARHTALRIGGPADLLVVVESAEALQRAVTTAWSHGVPCRVLGSGSNVLVSDAGMRGMVVLNRAKRITFPASGEGQAPGKEPTVLAESGASLPAVARLCLARGLAGLEWAVGIPGTVGGAVVGNAGAWGSDVASTLIRAIILEPDGQVGSWPVRRLGYGYRSSSLKGQSTERQAVVLAAEFALHSGEEEALPARVEEITARRKASQPTGATCGSVFKNPPGDYAGRLIEAAGLKGRRAGQARISEKHANFIVNAGGATALEVKALIDLCRESVQTQFGIDLQLEIELLGEW